MTRVKKMKQRMGKDDCNRKNISFDDLINLIDWW